MALWNVGQRYRGRALKGEAQIARNENGTRSAEVMLEVTDGPQAGARIRYRGYISGPGGKRSQQNEEMAAAELRAMGCVLSRWGDWAGLGSKVCEWTVLSETNEEGKTYYRAAFVGAPASVNRARAVSDEELDALPPPPSVSTANGRASAPSRDVVADEEEVSFP